jgi:hypothetical protein
VRGVRPNGAAKVAEAKFLAGSAACSINTFSKNNTMRSEEAHCNEIDERSQMKITLRRTTEIKVRLSDDNESITFQV